MKITIKVQGLESAKKELTRAITAQVTQSPLVTQQSRLIQTSLLPQQTRVGTSAVQSGLLNPVRVRLGEK